MCARKIRGRYPRIVICADNRGIAIGMMFTPILRHMYIISHFLVPKSTNALLEYIVCGYIEEPGIVKVSATK